MTGLRAVAPLLALGLCACRGPAGHVAGEDAGVADAGADHAPPELGPDGPADQSAEGVADATRADAEVCPVPPSTDPLVVRTTRGLVKGKKSGATTAFLGIPYAEPPVGSRRFAPPEPRTCWWDVRDATRYGERCPQMSYLGTYLGDEDCLFLNVWTPALPGPGSSPLPVMFFIHGGGHVSGSSNEGLSSILGQAAGGVGNVYEGQTLAENNQAVVVTINYRLGALGFLAHPALSQQSATQTSGNYGLLDAIAALRWVRHNIAAFGGDPGRVLVFGESAGAILTCMLLVTPSSAGLFSAALMQSGSCEVPRLPTREQQGEDLAQGLGCSDVATAAACLRGQTAKRLAEQLRAGVDFFSSELDPSRPWDILSCGPNIDGHVIPDDPMKIIRAGQHHHVPFAIGTNSHEVELFVPRSAFKSCAEYDAQAQQMLGPLASTGLGLYPCASYASARMAAVDLATDLAFTCYARRIARAVAGAQSEPVFRYFYTHRYKRSLIGLVMHAFHASELPFVFQSFSNIAYFPTSSETALSDAMQQYWSGLAATGRPAAQAAPVWPEHAAQDDPMIVLDEQITTRSRHKAPQCDFWDTVAQP